MEKRLIQILTLIAALSMLLIGCREPTEDTGDGGTVIITPGVSSSSSDTSSSSSSISSSDSSSSSSSIVSSSSSSSASTRLPGKITADITGMSPNIPDEFIMLVFDLGKGPDGAVVESGNGPLSGGAATAITGKDLSPGDYDVYCFIDRNNNNKMDVTSDILCPYRAVTIDGNVSISFKGADIRVQITNPVLGRTSKIARIGLYLPQFAAPDQTNSSGGGDLALTSVDLNNLDLTGEFVQEMTYYVYGIIDDNVNGIFGDKGDKFFGGTSDKKILIGMNQWTYDYTAMQSF